MQTVIKLCVFTVLYIAAGSSQAATWQTYNPSFEGGTIRVIHPDWLNADRSRMEWMIEIADRSTRTTNPVSQDYDGLLSKGDVVVFTSNLMLWFDSTSTGGITTNGGGGLLRGLWPIIREGSGALNFKRIINTYNYAPNYYFAGSKPNLQGSGLSLLGSLAPINVDNGVTCAIEHEQNDTITAATGTTISSGVYTGGLFVQFQGNLANSEVSQSVLTSYGLGDHYDTDTTPSVLGRTQYTLTYRIPPSGEEFRQEISLYVTQNKLGYLSTLVLSNNMAGYDGQIVKFVSSPTMTGGTIQVDGTRHFVFLGYILNFYDLPWSSHGTVQWSQIAGGQGLLLGAGMPHLSPEVPFIESRPLVNVLPTYAQTRYKLQAIDNQAASPGNRCIAMDLQLWDINAGHTAQVFNQGTTQNIITDYMLHYKQIIDQDGPGAVSWDNNRVDVVTRSIDGEILQRYWVSGTGWNDGANLGGITYDSPAIASRASGLLAVFTRGTNGALYKQSWNGSSWSGWENLGGAMISGPAATSWDANRLDVVVRGTNNIPYLKSWTSAGGWSGWNSLGGATAGKPAVCSWESGRLDVFIQGGAPDYNLYHKYYWAGAWYPSQTTWYNLYSGPLASGPAAVAWGPNRIDVFFRGNNNSVYWRSYSNGTWANSVSLGGNCAGEIAASSLGSGLLDVFIRTPDNSLYKKSYSNSQWEPSWSLVGSYY